MMINFKLFLCAVSFKILIIFGFPDTHRQQHFRPLITSRIVGGYQTSIETFPYQVSVQKRGAHVCGGAIVRRKFLFEVLFSYKRKFFDRLDLNGSLQWHTVLVQMRQIS